MQDIFLSYNREDQDRADHFVRGLEAAGMSVWWDVSLRSGELYDEVTENALRTARAVVVLWSQRSVASRWVRAEATLAQRLGTFVPCMIEPCERPIMFELTQTADLSHWQGDQTDGRWQGFAGHVREVIEANRGTDAKSDISPARPPGNAPHAAAAPTHKAPAAKPHQGPAEVVLAVLAFDNLSSDPELGFFCEGVTEEIQITVASGSDLKVVARASSFQFRRNDRPIAEIARALGATHLLCGSVRRGGNRVRIGAELVEAASTRALWSDRYDGDLEDVFALQDTIAANVANALKVTFAPKSAKDVLDPLTYETFLKARSVLAQGDPQFDDSPRRAIPLLEEVVGIAPDYAPAWDLLALSSADFLRFGEHEMDFETARAGVQAAADKALKLNPRSSGAWRALAMLEPWGDYLSREGLLHQALKVAPNDPGVLTDLSNFCWTVGRFHEALGYAVQASELNPLMPAARLHAAQMRAYVKEYEESVRQLEELHSLWPQNFGILLAWINWSSGLGFHDVFNRAICFIEDFNGLQAQHLRTSQFHGEAVLEGDPEKKAKWLERANRMLEHKGTVPLNLLVGLCHMGLHAEAKALAAQCSYEYIFDPSGPGPAACYPGVALGPWSTLFDDPAFVDLCDRLGLCRYWVESGQWPDCAEWVPYDFKAETLARMVQAATGPAAI